MRKPDEILAEINKLLRHLDKLTEANQGGQKFKTIKFGDSRQAIDQQKMETEERLRQLYHEYIDIMIRNKGASDLE